MVSRVMLILELLSDGKWHEVELLLARVGLSERQFAEVAVFLSKYNFVVFDEAKSRVKINRDFKKLLVQPVA
jgi:hypothetical protein